MKRVPDRIATEPLRTSAFLLVVFGTSIVLVLVGYTVIRSASGPENQPTSGHAGIVLMTSGPRFVEVWIPFPVSRLAGTAYYGIQPDTEYWFQNLAQAYPPPPGSYSGAERVSQDGEWLRVVTNGTVVLEIEWTPRALTDVFPFGPPGEHPSFLHPRVVDTGSSFRMLLISFAISDGFFFESAADYALTSVSGMGPSGNYPDSSLGIDEVLGQHADPLTLDSTGSLPLTWGRVLLPSD